MQIAPLLNIDTLLIAMEVKPNFYQKSSGIFLMGNSYQISMFLNLKKLLYFQFAFEFPIAFDIVFEEWCLWKFNIKLCRASYWDVILDAT